MLKGVAPFVRKVVEVDMEVLWKSLHLFHQRYYIYIIYCIYVIEILMYQPSVIIPDDHANRRKRETWENAMVKSSKHEWGVLALDVTATTAFFRSIWQTSPPLSFIHYEKCMNRVPPYWSGEKKGVGVIWDLPITDFFFTHLSTFLGFLKLKPHIDMFLFLKWFHEAKWINKPTNVFQRLSILRDLGLPEVLIVAPTPPLGIWKLWHNATSAVVS